MAHTPENIGTEALVPPITPTEKVPDCRKTR